MYVWLCDFRACSVLVPEVPVQGLCSLRGNCHRGWLSPEVSWDPLLTWVRRGRASLSGSRALGAPLGRGQAFLSTLSFSAQLRAWPVVQRDRGDGPGSAWSDPEISVPASAVLAPWCPGVPVVCGVLGQDSQLLTLSLLPQLGCCGPVPEVWSGVQVKQ